MEWTSLNDLREKYLSFFESKGHLRLKSFSLVPDGDKSLLLINSGMAPMKKYFTGEVTPPNNRVTTCQKCIRTPDIEQVGKTARHGTFFEMLGNFSFGDYFKKEATAWAWEFCTKVLEMPVDKLYVTIYENDDEAFEIWTKQNGVDPSHIVRLGKEDNFWEHGSGPCGPCSEIYFDRGEKYGCGSPDCGPGCECDRYTEFWNNVFSQFDNDGNGNYSELKQKNIDTGMGLERLACIMQGVDNIFEVDTVQNTMKKISEIAGVHYHDDAKKAIYDILSRGKTPIVAGGTGLYFRILLENYNLPRVEANPELRAELDLREKEDLLEELERLDKITFERVKDANKRRIVRALEVIKVLNRPLSEVELQKEPEFNVEWIMPELHSREELYERINKRVDIMVEKGLIDETKYLLKKHGRIKNFVCTIGYQEILAYLDGECSLEEALDKLKQHSRNYAKRQLTWFRKNPALEISI